MHAYLVCHRTDGRDEMRRSEAYTLHAFIHKLLVYRMGMWDGELKGGCACGCIGRHEILFFFVVCVQIYDGRTDFHVVQFNQ